VQDETKLMLKTPHWLPPAMLTVGGTILLGIGVFGLVSPQGILAPVGIHLDGASALNEIRASYGGMHVGVAGVILWGAAVPAMRRWALLLMAAFMAGLAGGRLVGIAVDGFPGLFVCQLLVIEAVLAVAAAWASKAA
jgi:hypothetical protein